MGIAIVIVVIASVVVSFRCYRNTVALKIPPSTWKRFEQNFESKSLLQVEDVNILPSWLKTRPEMIYSQRCIQQTGLLGKGQFGTVYKGKLIQVNSVYVISFLYLANSKPILLDL